MTSMACFKIIVEKLDERLSYGMGCASWRGFKFNVPSGYMDQLLFRKNTTFFDNCFVKILYCLNVISQFYYMFVFVIYLRNNSRTI